MKNDIKNFPTANEFLASYRKTNRRFCHGQWINENGACCPITNFLLAQGRITEKDFLKIKNFKGGNKEIEFFSKRSGWTKEIIQSFINGIDFTWGHRDIFYLLGNETRELLEGKFEPR